MKLPSIELRVRWLMDAITKNRKTEVPLTEDEYMKLVQSVVRPFVRKIAREARKDESYGSK